MGRLLEIVTPLHTATKRDYMARMLDDLLDITAMQRVGFVMKNGQIYKKP